MLGWAWLPHKIPYVTTSHAVYSISQRGPSFDGRVCRSEARCSKLQLLNSCEQPHVVGDTENQGHWWLTRFLANSVNWQRKRNVIQVLPFEGNSLGSQLDGLRSRSCSPSTTMEASSVRRARAGQHAASTWTARVILDAEWHPLPICSLR